jgi:hypothetical protein
MQACQYCQNDRSRKADCAAAKPKMVTVLVTYATVGHSYPTNRKEDMLRGTARKKPNVLSPILALRMNELRDPKPKTRRNF